MAGRRRWFPPAKFTRQRNAENRGLSYAPAIPGPHQRAATISERCSLVTLSAERRWRGPSRSCRGEGNRQHSGPEGMLDLCGVPGGGTLGKSKAEQERPYLAAKSGKGRAYRAGRLKSRGAGRESEGSVVPVKACSKTRWREGALLWSSRPEGKREGMPETANNPSVEARQLRGPAMDVCQVRSSAVGPGEGLYRRSDNPSKGLIPSVRGRHARHVKKIIVKPCAGKPQAGVAAILACVAFVDIGAAGAPATSSAPPNRGFVPTRARRRSAGERLRWCHRRWGCRAHGPAGRASPFDPETARR